MCLDVVDTVSWFLVKCSDIGGTGSDEYQMSIIERCSSVPRKVICNVEIVNIKYVGHKVQSAQKGYMPCLNF